MHSSSAPDTLWTTVNVSEAVPGVTTPLGWSVWGPALDAGVRGTFAEFGVLTPTERAGPHGEHDRIVSIFFGRAALRADFMLTMGERLPGTSGTDVATALFDGVPEGYASCPERRYYPRAALRIPQIMLRSPGLIRAIRTETEPWWRRETTGIGSAATDDARRVFGDAVDRFTRVMFLHTMVTFSVVQPAYDQLSALVTAAGVGTGLLSGGGGDHEETRLVHDLWACSRGTLELDLAEALVIDIGGMLSHAAIVARELGVPCVANTKTGTRLLRTGDLIRVDGGAGRIDVLERVGEPVTTD